ncbi:hypothetical protein DMI62_19130 [Escherichia coli]|nr:hypothetical protein [Escherichia coli]
MSNHRHSHDCELLNKIQTGKHFDEYLLKWSLPPDGEALMFNRIRISTTLLLILILWICRLQ